MAERNDQDLSRRRPENAASKSAFRAIAFIALAVVTAVVGAVLLTRWINARTAVAKSATAPVVVATVDLAIGAEIRPDNLVVVEFPVASRPPSAVQDPAPLAGRVVAQRIYRGEPVIEEKLAGARAGSGLAALLPDGMRAVSVRVDDVVGVAGFIHPGDFVDVIVTMQSTSKIFLQKVKVLAVGKEIDADKKANVAATVATLMVDSDQAERLALGAARGQLLLALRSSTDGEVVETRGVQPNVLLALAAPVAAPAAPEPREPARKAKPRAVAKKAPAPPAHPQAQPEKERNVVEILRGDLYERRDFEKGAKR